MPHGISRFVGPVVSFAVLMPVTAAHAQGVPVQPASRDLTVAEVNGSFVIRAQDERGASPALLRLGKTIRLDRAVTLRGQSANTASNAASDNASNGASNRASTITAKNEGGTHETR